MATDKKPRREPNNHGPSGMGRDYAKLRALRFVSWSEISPGEITDAINRVTDTGAAIMFGRTSDGGAYSITVLDGTDRIREWPHTVDECSTTLKWLAEMFASD